jgi:Arc/MetJ family transcription regulator
MRTTVNLDDDLLSIALNLTGIASKSALINEGLRVLVQREAARKLATLGGSQPDLVLSPRRRPEQQRRKKLYIS